MSLIAELTAATHKYYSPVVIDQIFQYSPLLYRIFKIAKEGSWGLAQTTSGGRKIAETLEYQETAQASGSHGGYASSDTWVADDEDSLTQAEYSWKMYHATVKIPNITVSENSAKARIFDIAAIRLKNASKTLRKDLATDLYADETGESGTTMMGLRALVKATGTIGGIDKGSYSWWQGVISTAESNRTLTWAILNDLFMDTKHYGDGVALSLFVCSDGVMQNYEDTYTKVVGADTSTSGVRLALQSGKVLEGGFRSFMFKGIPIVSDPFCPANKLFGLTEQFLHARILKQFGTLGWKSIEDQGKDYLQATFKGYLAFTCSCARKQSMAEALTEA